jgi:hypothetical protein
MKTLRAANIRTQVDVAADLHLEGAQFESWPDYWLSGLRTSRISSVSPGVCGYRTLKLTKIFKTLYQ